MGDSDVGDDGCGVTAAAGKSESSSESAVGFGRDTGGRADAAAAGCSGTALGGEEAIPVAAAGCSELGGSTGLRCESSDAGEPERALTMVIMMRNAVDNVEVVLRTRHSPAAMLGDVDGVLKV